MKRVNRIFVVLFLLLFCFAAGAQSPGVITTNGWTAAFAELAGVEEPVVLAPYEMRHPPEYELSPGELRRVSQADFVIFAGYEAMMTRIKEALGEDSSVVLIQIKTVNNYQVISQSVMKIAAALGTEAAARENLVSLKTFMDEWKEELTDNPLLKDPAVHFHQQGLARGLGLSPSLVFGPAPPGLGQIRDVLKVKPRIIIDNLHNPVAGPFLEQAPPPKVVGWINFPGTGGTRSLLDVLRYNRNELNRVMDAKD